MNAEWGDHDGHEESGNGNEWALLQHCYQLLCNPQNILVTI